MGHLFARVFEKKHVTRLRDKLDGGGHILESPFEGKYCSFLHSEHIIGIDTSLDR